MHETYNMYSSSYQLVATVELNALLQFELCTDCCVREHQYILKKKRQHASSYFEEFI